MKFQAAVAVAGVCLLAGCASIMNDDTQKVNVSASNGAAISGTVDGKPFSAPGVVELTRANADKVFTTDATGCAKETVAQKSVDSKFFVNILSGGTFGSTTDYSTERMWKYSDNVVIACK
jgi:hypothetical protein